MRKKILIFVTILCLFISFGIMTYAYFIKEIKGGSHGISSNPDDSQVVEVFNFDELTQAVRLYEITTEEFNSSGDTSISTNRKTIKFTNDIRLKSNLLINADCHIDLNNHSLDLAGYTVTFRYRFDGVYSLYGGTIDDTSILDEEGMVIEGKTAGGIIVDCPKENFDFDESIIKEGININVSYATDEQIATSAMNMILSNIQNHGVNDFYTINNNVQGKTFDECTFTHSKGSMCVYTYTDLDLITNYYNYKNFSVTYKSSDTKVLTNKGNLKLPTTSQTVDLTIEVKYGTETVEKVVSVHILVSNADYLNASNSILNEYLSKYYNADLGALQFDTSFLLPKVNSYLGTTYSYELFTTTENFTVTSEEVSEFFDTETYDNYYLVSLSNEIVGLEITSIKSGSGITTDKITVTGESTTVIDDNHSYAVNVARMLYNNQIFINKDSKKDSGYTERNDILIDPNEHGFTRIESITNALTNNNEGTYELSNFPELDTNGSANPKHGKYQILRVDKDNDTLPYLGQTVFLEITFKFKSYYGGDIVVVQVPIIYEPPKEVAPGQSFPAFDPYYVYFDKEFSKANRNYGYESFSMPLSYDGNPVNPIYTFVIFEYKNSSYTRLTDGQLFTQSLTNGSYTDFDKTTLMNITINPYYINKDTTDYLFAYVPTYLNSTDDGVYYYDPISKTTTNNISNITINIESYPYKSVLTVPGIVRYQSSNSVYTEEFADKEFYVMAYNLLSYDSYEEGKFLLSSELQNHIAQIDFSNSSNLSFSASDRTNYIDSLKGINLMTGINVLRFAGVNLANNGTQFVTELGYVSDITNLKILDLSNTGIYDHTQSNLAQPSGNNNNFLASLTKLVNLEELYLHNDASKTDAPVNRIFYFDALGDFSGLKKVNIAGNSFTATSNISFLNTPMTNLANSLYGTFGANNIGVLTILEANGVEVIRGSGNSDELQQEFKDIVTALSSLAYQDRLDENVSIDNVLALYPSGTSTDLCIVYNLPQSFVLANNTDIAFSFTSVVFSGNSNGFTMTINYHWVQNTLFGDDGDVAFTTEYRIAGY